MNVLILGAGQVGSALATLIKHKYPVTVMDREARHVEGEWTFDVLHVCYPYSEWFVNNTCFYIDKFKPKLMLIESTVKPKTTWKLHNYYPDQPLCHSPVRGCHSSLLWGLETYTKFIGPCTVKAGLMAERYYKSLGLKTYVAKGPTETECAKLMNLSYYAAQIALFQEFERKKEEYNLEYGDVLRFFETTTEESRGEVPRPIFKGECIGGTCVMPGLNMLFNPTKLAEWINHSNLLRREELIAQKMVPFLKGETV